MQMPYERTDWSLYGTIGQQTLGAQKSPCLHWAACAVARPSPIAHRPASHRRQAMAPCPEFMELLLNCLLVLCVLSWSGDGSIPLFPPSRPPFLMVLVEQKDREGDAGEEERSEKKRVADLVARDCRGRKRRRETQELTMMGAVEDGKPARPLPLQKNHSLGIVETLGEVGHGPAR